ncbi:hypothetical protein [Methanosarcina horonobensis]|uniref:hypothetical protein n=1 Tax=Methanosarcina horonobensis TaxID=418008 RepID=UPI001EF4152A|nr:hypothetical protein [Methanosarcina horonobensis]
MEDQFWGITVWEKINQLKKTLVDVNARSVRSKLTVHVHRIKLKVQEKQWNICPQETSHIRSISLGCIAQKRSHDVRTLTLTDNAFVIRVMSGKSMVSKIQIRIITSVSMAEQLNY